MHDISKHATLIQIQIVTIPKGERGRYQARIWAEAGVPTAGFPAPFGWLSQLPPYSHTIRRNKRTPGERGRDDDGGNLVSSTSVVNDLLLRCDPLLSTLKEALLIFSFR